MAYKIDMYNEISDKLQIAKNILLRCETPYVHKEPNRLERAICYYTGVERSIINDVLKKTKEKKTFLDWSSNGDSTTKDSLITFEQMRNILIDQYVNNQQIPTKLSIVEDIRGIAKSNKNYTALLLQQDLNNLGFRWKRLRKSDKYIIVEKLDQATRRMKYLQQMKEYRESSRVLVYIERTIPCYYYITKHRVHSTTILAAASPQLGTIDTYFPPKLQTLDFWLRNKLHTIPPNSVFVVDQANRASVDLELTGKLPTIHSRKRDMMEWLETYGIPYDSTLHRGELFALIEKHEVYCPPIYKFCEFIKAAGHDVILRPPELAHIKFFKRILKPVFDKKSVTLPEFKEYVIATMNKPPEYWLGEDQRMAEAEQKIYEEDQKLELILDRLMENIKNKSLKESDFNDCEQDEFDREFYDNVVCDAAPALMKKPIPKPGAEQEMCTRPLGSDSPTPGPSST